MSDEAAVPPAVRLVRDFVNTYEPQVGAESLTSPDRLRDWFAERSLIPAGARLRHADLELALAVREGLRDLLRDPAERDRLDGALTAVPVRLSPAQGGMRLVAVRDTAAQRALAGLVDAIRQCGEDGTWPRLKVCARDTCRWAFYDASRNQARRWCSMAGCGNHVKMKRAYAVRRNRGPQA
jgi:predicted RNA-binding Zn ribbon-like protein